jgi:hypothetical protein
VTIQGNVDIPAGYDVKMIGTTVTGNVTVEGYLHTSNAHIMGNLTVNGLQGGAFENYNVGSTFDKNVTITGSTVPNGGMNAFTTDDGRPASHILNNLIYENNPSPLFVGYSGVVVDHNANISGNGGNDFLGSLNVNGQRNIS